ncbi:hypothetical protein M959_02434, partial [Chaetura pelagica]
FAFSVPSVNKAEPAKRYHWVVLPKGMKSSPTMCQVFVAWALEPVCKRYPQLIISHYMDDILIAGEKLQKETILQILTSELKQRGLQIAPEKIQQQSPWKYLGWIITGSSIKPQKVEVKSDVKTLNDVQKLVGDIQWVRKICGIANDGLKPLIQLLGTSIQANEKQSLGPEQQRALSQISEKI